VTDRLLTLDEVARTIGCSVATVKRRVRAGLIPVFRDGRIVRLREADLRRYVARTQPLVRHPESRAADNSSAPVIFLRDAAGSGTTEFWLSVRRTRL
jgi:excisionase family DNA binding protein